MTPCAIKALQILLLDVTLLIHFPLAPDGESESTGAGLVAVAVHCRGPVHASDTTDTVRGAQLCARCALAGQPVAVPRHCESSARRLCQLAEPSLGRALTVPAEPSTERAGPNQSRAERSRAEWLLRHLLSLSPSGSQLESVSKRQAEGKDVVGSACAVSVQPASSSPCPCRRRL